MEEAYGRNIAIHPRKILDNFVEGRLLIDAFLQVRANLGVVDQVEFPCVVILDLSHEGVVVLDAGTESIDDAMVPFGDEVYQRDHQDLNNKLPSNFFQW